MEAHAHGGRHPDRVRIVVRTTFDAVARRQESVEPLDEVRVAREQRADSADHAGRINGAALEILHDIEEAVVNVWLVGELHLHLVEIRQGVVEDRLLALALSLPLTLPLLLLGLLLRRLLGLRTRCEGHQHPRLHLLPSRCRRLGRRLDGTAREDIRRAARCTHREMWLWLRCGWKRVVEHTVRAQRCSRSDRNRLMQWHRRTRRALMRRRLLETLPLLLFSSSILLLFDLYLLLLSSSFALPLRCARLASRLAETGKGQSGTVRTCCRRLLLSW